MHSCPECQKAKKAKKAYGHLPPKDLEQEAVLPWKRVNVDMVGPLTAHAKNGKFSFRALTMIDPATGWFEIAEVKGDPNSENVAKAFDIAWLSRYPRPSSVGYDNGGENKGLFKEMIENYGLTGVPTSGFNPQSNGIIERVHLVLA